MNHRTKKMVIGVILIILALGLLVFLRGNEDDWIKDEKGIWIKHGNPASTPVYVLEQKDALTCAAGLYEQKKNEGMNFSSQCLGACGNFSVDIVHVPRTGEDNKQENQCPDFRGGKTKGFMELDSEGKVVRVYSEE